MIKTEFYRTRDDGVNLYRTHSDSGLMIRKVGTDEVYEEAIDIENSGYTYEETDILIDGGTIIDPEEATETDLYNALAELGVTDDEESNT